MEAVVVTLLALVGLINVAPLVGIASRSKLEALYGTPVDTPELAVLLRHRALLFGLVGGLTLASIGLAELRPAALTLCLLSMLGYLLLVAQERTRDPSLRRVAAIDLAGVAFATAALVIGAL